MSNDEDDDNPGPHAVEGSKSSETAADFVADFNAAEATTKEVAFISEG